MKIYILYNIIMNTIIYLEDNKGVSEVEQLIRQIAFQGISGDQDAQHLAKYIRQGMAILKDTSIPTNQRLQAIFEEDNGDKRTLQILKPLRKVPLLEFRVNRSIPGAFRAIFFEYEYEGENLLVFTKGLLKKGDPNPPELQQKINDSHKIYLDFCRDPKKYLD
ncbi:hypothetical protein [Bacillus sp. ISL-7]|uniref:hypothetical protein n=1 Tax=Bacillus sp. ISL-7 TaxID=2819136 RepID=UPI001BEB1E89|nr:hypothetical protein [Bacillus sp. ISL-7]MBT2734118.1 hypothetical protein [Bacillus sp. ISL-7]